MREPDNNRERALAALALILDGVVDVIKAHPTGAPSGVIYASLMGHMNLNQYQAMIDALVAANKIEKRGHLLFARS